MIEELNMSLIKKILKNKTKEEIVDLICNIIKEELMKDEETTQTRKKL